jgi:hypothetical protein
MKAEFIFALALAAMSAGTSVLAHGRSEQMKQELNAKTPEWLSIGESIHVEPGGSDASENAAFRTLSGDSQSTRDRVIIPSRGIEIKVDYPISSYYGSSLSPDGTKLIVNSGTSSRLYEILSTGEHQEVELQLPHVTYDAGLKGYITGWSWADNKTLIARSEITDETGHEIVENRIYVFHMKERALSRLDFSDLNLPTTDGLEVTKVGSDLNHLKIIIGNSEFTVKADLKSPPKVKVLEMDAPKTTTSVAAPKQSALKTPEAKPPSTPSEEPASSTPWSIIGVLIVAAIGLLWLVLRRRS